MALTLLYVEQPGETGTMAYVPPHMRGKASNIAEADEPTTSSSHFASSPPPAAEPMGHLRSKTDVKTAPYTRFEIHAHYWPSHEITHAPVDQWKGTLSSSEDKPDTLQYVILYHEANPRWDSDHIIFVKTNLRLLGLENTALEPKEIGPQTLKNLRTRGNNQDIRLEEPALDVQKDHQDPDSTRSTDKLDDGETTENVGQGSTTQEPTEQPIEAKSTSMSRNVPTQPIAIFEQVRKGTQDGRLFDFLGHYKIVLLDHLAPHSDALARMLTQKWEGATSKQPEGAFWGKRPQRPRERDAAAWGQSFNMPWAVVKFEKIDENGLQQQALLPPDIKTCEDDGVTRTRTKKNTENEKPRKSVNEMLQELRLGNEAKGKTPDKSREIDEVVAENDRDEEQKVVP